MRGRGRKSPEEEPENLERWLISYSDFMTLLVAFFVVMYAISSVNVAKYRVLSQTLMNVFSHVPMAVHPIEIEHHSTMSPPVQAPDIRPALPQVVSRPIPLQSPPTMQPLLSSIRKALAPLIKHGQVHIDTSQLGIVVHINSDVLFPTGSSLMNGDAIPIISKLGMVLQTVNNPVQVQGYTDNRPIHNSHYSSNWSLSVARSVTVVSLFQVLGVAPGRMVAAGFGETHPIATNSTRSGRARNRRVDIVILAKPWQKESEWPMAPDTDIASASG